MYWDHHQEKRPKPYIYSRDLQIRESLKFIHPRKALQDQDHIIINQSSIPKLKYLKIYSSKAS